MIAPDPIRALLEAGAYLGYYVGYAVAAVSLMVVAGVSFLYGACIAIMPFAWLYGRWKGGYRQ